MIIKQGRADFLEYRVYDTRKNMGIAAAKDAAFIIKKLLCEKSEISAIFAAAPSQNELLESLLSDKTIDFKKINAFHMDEYIGLSPDHPKSFGKFLTDKLFGRAPFKSVNLINGLADDIVIECGRYSALLSEVKPEIVFMGIGENGHIAFNDPHVADFHDPLFVKVVELDQTSIHQQVNDGCFASVEEVPTKAITLTIPALMAPEYIFCVVPAATKANAVSALINGEVGNHTPSTSLRLRRGAILYTDTDSAGKIL